MICLSTASFGLGMICGHSFGKQSMAEQAIKANVAEYQVDKQSGEVKFVWKK